MLTLYPETELLNPFISSKGFLVFSLYEIMSSTNLTSFFLIWMPFFLA